MYWAVIIPLQKPLFHLLYSDRYLDVAYLLPALALGQIFWSATFGPSLALRAMESPGSVFAALGAATVASLGVGVPATWFFGLKGAIWGSNAADVFSFVALWWVLTRKLSAQADDVALPSRWFGAKKGVPSGVAVEVSEEA
jgi:O-antigen/teichoic acid export membrane protein